MLSHFEATVLRGRPSLSVEKGVDAIFSVRSEVETVSTETISKSFSIPLLSSEDVNVLSPTPYARKFYSFDERSILQRGFWTLQCS